MYVSMEIAMMQMKLFSVINVMFPYINIVMELILFRKDLGEFIFQQYENIPTHLILIGFVMYVLRRKMYQRLLVSYALIKVVPIRRLMMENGFMDYVLHGYLKYFPKIQMVLLWISLL